MAVDKYKQKRSVDLCVSRRSQRGMYMIELLMAIAVSAMLGAALVDNMAQTMQFSSASQNQLLAASIAQEQIDNARNLTYSQLLAMAGTYSPGNNPLLVNRTTSGQIGAAPNPRPLLLDKAPANFTWTTRGSNNMFPGTVTEVIQPGPYANTMQVIITINWTEGTQAKSYSLSTLVAENGIHNE